ESFQHEAIVVHRVALGLRSVEEGVVAGVIEAWQTVPRAVVAREQEPRLITLVPQQVLQLERAGADVAELAAGQRARDPAERFRAGGERRLHFLHASALHE